MQQGINGPADFVEAKQWFLAASERGHPGAMYRLGELWFDGKMADGSDAQAVAWWTKAAESGFTAAQHRLALLYMRGQGGLPRDERAARHSVKI
jgi:TPR repeat protein